ncbi:MAG: efflux RND transporter periplasmic adaptor subunit [Candidatus Thiodiazotropha endolucinida]
MNKAYHTVVLSLCLVLTGPLPAADDHGHEHEHEASTPVHNDEPARPGMHRDEHEHEREMEGGLQLSAQQRRQAGIQIETLLPQPIENEIEAPGEIRLNHYATRQVTPRIDAQIIERHARLGDSVTVGQPLVSLSSVAMSEAQATLLSAQFEWQRVRKLGRKVVSERRYQEARIAAQQARSRLLAYGMTADQIDRLAKGNQADQTSGRFDLLAAIDGTVVHDDFVVGQMVAPGDRLFEISDESRLWVEARLDPASTYRIKEGSPARILVNDHWLKGKVSQVHHALDETTRTLSVRLTIPNPEDRLHSGQFVTVRIASGKSGETGLLLPTDAVLHSPDGDWQVFVEQEPGTFEPMEVKIIRQLGDRVVIEGIAPGTRVVTEGAFFVQSELAKSGFDVHNH